MTEEGTCECDPGFTYLGKRYRSCYDVAVCSNDQLSLGPTDFKGIIDALTYDFDRGNLTPDIIHDEECPVICSYEVD